MSDGRDLLGQIAIQFGAVTAEQLDECLRAQAAVEARGERQLLGQVFIARGLVDGDGVFRLLQEQERRLEEPPPLKRYEVRKRLGEGSAAVVHLAWDQTLQRPVAMKVLRPAVAVGVAARERFLREARTAAGLQHPNVVGVYDVGEAEGRLYIVMEFIDGRPLILMMGELARDRRRLVEVLERASRGVAAAHAQGIVHRDLKPANIFVTRTGDPKVGDFGLARRVMPGARLTDTGVALGTPNYMAPEQVTAGELTPRTDVHALGAILYEGLTARLPHAGATAGEVFAKILGEEIQPPRAIDRTIPRELEAIVLRAMAREPANRYGTASEFADDLARWLAGEPVTARVPSGAPQAFVALAVIVAAAAGVWLLLRDWRGSPRGPVAPAPVQAPMDDDAEARRAKELDPLLEGARAGLEAAQRVFYRPNGTPAELASNVAAARRFIDEAVRRAPKSAVARHLLGRAHELQGEDAEADAAWRKAIALDPSYGPARFHRGRLLLARSHIATLAVNEEMRELRRPEAERLAREAQAEIEAAIASGWDDPLARQQAATILAWANYDMKNVHDQAHEGMERFKGRDGVEEFHWLCGASINPGKEKDDELDEAIRLRPNFALARLSRAMERSSKDNAAGAKEDLDVVIGFQPRFAQAYMMRAIALKRLGRLDEALTDLNVSLTLQDLPEARVNRCTLTVMSNPRAALEDAELALKAVPRYVEALFMRGTARRLLGEFEEAIADFDVVIARQPKFALGHAGRGLTLARQADLAGALRDLDAAIRLAPGMSEFYLNRASVRRAAGGVAGAFEDLEKVIELEKPGTAARARAEEFLKKWREE